MRYHLVPFASKILLDKQFGGGFSGGDNTFLLLYVRCVEDGADAVHMSGVLLFLAVIAAFAKLLRRIVFDGSQGDEIRRIKLPNAGSHRRIYFRL